MIQILNRFKRRPPLVSWQWHVHFNKRANLSSLIRNNHQDIISLHVIGNGAAANPRSVIINYNDRLFMFNCGEGLQRTLPEYGFKASRVERCFITSNNWHNVSGLSSLLLNRFDSGIQEFNIVGLNTEEIIKECTRFDTKLKRVKYNYFDCESDHTFQCDHLSVRSTLLNYDDGDKSVAFLASVAAQKGTICLEKCFQLRVPRQLVTKLEEGIPVTLENGQSVMPADVFKPDQPERRILILESTSSKFIQTIEQNSTIKEFLQRCDCIVHFTQSKLLNQPDYRSFIKNLSKSYHLLISESNPSPSLHSTHRFQTQLNCIDSKLFPMLKEKISVTTDNNEWHNLENEKAIHCPTGLTFQIRPQSVEESPISLDPVISSDLHSIENALKYKDGSTREGLTETLQSLHESQKTTLPTSNLTYPEFVFLGTASSVSLPIRNVSGILVNLSPTESILLECGENMYGQLVRFYGPQNIERILNNLKAIFISHHHSDHHIGLVQLIEKRHYYTGNKLTVIMPPMVSKFLHSKSLCFSSLNNLNSKYNYVINRYFDQSKSNFSRIFESVKNVQLIPVSHSAFAYGISITSKSGFKFVYSGDTQPCDSLIQQGRDCDLLIHESTVEDGLVNFARTHFHSTMSEAINVGKMMNARFTILTHFSQRYGKLPFVSTNAHNSAVGLAFDNMRITPSEFHRLPLMYDALKCMYAKHLENLEYRSELYGRKYTKVN